MAASELVLSSREADALLLVIVTLMFFCEKALLSLRVARTFDASSGSLTVLVHFCYYSISSRVDHGVFGTFV
jgi:hypothetical protein